MKKKSKIAINLFEKFEDGESVEKYYLISVPMEAKDGEMIKQLQLSEEEFKEFKKVFIDFINKQK